MSWFLSAPLQPFSIAALILLGLVLIEVLGMLFGHAPSSVLHHAGLDHMFEGALGWLNLGRVPFLVLLMVLLAMFAAGGMVLQAFAARSIGVLPPLIASGLAGAFALTTTGAVSRLVGRILPRDESYALADDDLVGRVGTVTVGPLESHVVGKISIVDGHGNRHFPRARPAEAGQVIEVGAAVLVVSTKGREYRVIPAPAELAEAGRSGIELNRRA